MFRTRPTLRVAVAVLATVLPTAAWAHPGHDAGVGFVDGLVHPVTGLDHVLAMVAVGLFAAQLGGRALSAVPLSFVSVMALGGVLGATRIGFPFVEVGIAVSVIVLGLAIAVQWKAPVTVAMALVGLFAVFHGYAHGAEMPIDASGIEYGLGFVMATMILHALGIGLAFSIARFGQVATPRTIRIGGAAMAVAGAGILSGFI